MDALPDEMILSIGQHLGLRSLLNLSLTSLKFKSILKDMLLEARQRHELRGFDGQDRSKHTWPYHELPKRVLRDESTASYVKDFSCNETIQNDDRRLVEALYDDRDPPQISPVEMLLLRTKLASTPWILHEEREDLIDRMFSGRCETAVLSVLLFLLPELRSLRPPLQESEDFSRVIHRICCAYNQHVSSNGEYRGGPSQSQMPLRKLTDLVELAADNDNALDGADLEHLLIWLGLPSLRN